MGSNKNNKLIKLEIAHLALLINKGDNDLNITLPKCHQKFLNMRETEGQESSVFFKSLKLDLSDTPAQYSPFLLYPIVRTEIWELWLDKNQDMIFFQPQQFPSVWIKVNNEYSSGEIIGNFSKGTSAPYYPLKNLDMIIYSNWLANFGDLILHASGIAHDGCGYAFIGESGAGKSTLVRNLAEIDGVSVLGEDQVVLRYLDGLFYIFGTPWHLESNMCSPVGVPLKHIFFLDRKLSSVTQKMNPLNVVVEILRTAFVPYFLHKKVKLILKRLETFTKQIECYSLFYQLGSDILPNIIDP